MSKTRSKSRHWVFRQSWSLYMLFAFVLVALLADVLARDVPILVSRDGSWVLFPREYDATKEEALLSPIVPFGPNKIDLSEDFLAAPSSRHPLGTDAIGRDLFAILVHGSRTSLLFGGATALLTMLFGTLLGIAIASFQGLYPALGGGRRWSWNRLAERSLSGLLFVVDAVPKLIWVLVLASFLVERHTFPLALIVASVSWSGFARMVRAQSFSVLATPYMDYARTAGFGRWRIIIRHVLPQLWSLLRSYVPLLVAASISVEAGLSFLGWGLPPYTASWGAVLAQTRDAWQAWWLLLFPLLALLLLLLSLYHLAGIGQARTRPINP